MGLGWMGVLCTAHLLFLRLLLEVLTFLVVHYFCFPFPLALFSNICIAQGLWHQPACFPYKKRDFWIIIKVLTHLPHPFNLSKIIPEIIRLGDIRKSILFIVKHEISPRIPLYKAREPLGRSSLSHLHFGSRGAASI